MNEAHDTVNQAQPGLRFRRATLLVIAALLTLSVAASPALGQSDWDEGASADGPSTDSENKPGYTADELQMVEEINTYRGEHGLSPLEISNEASEAAANHSSDMATYDFFGHDTKESDTYEPGADFSTRMDEAGYDYNTVRSENVAAGNTDVEPTLEQWKTSLGHNENMLREDLRVVGIGKTCSEDSTHGCYWTTDFGGYAPDDARPAGEIEPSQDERDTGSSDRSTANRSGEDSSSITDVEQSTNDDSGSGEDGSTEDSSESTQDSAEPKIEVVEQQNSGEEGSSGSGWSEGGSGDGGSGESQQAVQITQNGETRTLTGDEANEEICTQFGETREQVISGLREDTGSSSSGSSGAWSTGSESGATSEGSGTDDPAAEIQNDIADDFEESLLNPESCQGGDKQSSDSAEGTTGESTIDESTSGENAASDDSASDDASSDQYADSEDTSGEDTSSEDASNEDTGAGSDQYSSEGSDQNTSSDDISEGSEATGEDSTMEDTSMASEASSESSSGENTSEESTSEESTSPDSSNGNDDDESDAGDEDSGISGVLIFWK